MPDNDTESVDKIFILVCKGDSCSKRGRPDRVRVALKQLVREFPAKSVKVSFVSCLGMCGDGPNVLVCRGTKAYHHCTGAEAGDVVTEVRGRLGESDT
jgi:NADH:ubiquinone oxidoreductase subunit E